MSYKSTTNNWPVLPDWGHDGERPYLKRYDEPYWEIYVDEDDTVSVVACRPSRREVKEGDLNGRHSSVIRLAEVNRPAIKNALRLARILCRCNPKIGTLIDPEMLDGIEVIESDIPVVLHYAA